MKLAYLTSDAREAYGRYDRPAPYFGMGAGRLLEALRQLPDLEIHVVSCTRKHVSAPEKLHDNVWFHSLVVPRAGWLWTGYAGCMMAVRNLLKKIGPDMVHGQGTERDCALSAAFSGFPNVATVRGNMRQIARFYRARPFGYHWLAARLESVALRRTNGVICITRYAQEQVKDLARKTWVIPNAVSPGFFDIQSAPESPARILCVGTICPHKNQVQLIQALAGLASTKSFRLIFVGDGHKEHLYFQRFLADMSMYGWCEYKGVLDEKSIQRELSACTLLAHPTLEDNCPNVVLEAMAAGVPVVAGRVGGVPDLVDEGVTGFLVDPMNAHEIASAIAGLLDDPARGRSMGAEARRQARQKFHPDHIGPAHQRIYRDVLASNRSL